MERFLIHGASGSVGREVAALAVAAGLSPILAGRSKARLEPLARELGLDWVAFDAADRVALRVATRGVKLVFNAAGPTGTSLEVLEGCLERGAHYLDLGTQPAAYRAVYERDAAARAAGSTLIPGVGLDVVFADALFDLLAEKVEQPREAAVAYGPDVDPAWVKPLCRLLLSKGGLVWRDGGLHPVDAIQFRRIDLPEGPRPVFGPIPLAELASTSFGHGVPNVAAYYLPNAPALVELLERHASAPAHEKASAPALEKASAPAHEKTIEDALSELFAGARAPLRAVRIWAEIRGAGGQVRQGVIRVPSRVPFDGVARSMTSIVAFRAIQRVLEGGVAPGAWTPAKALGRKPILTSPGVEVQVP